MKTGKLTKKEVVELGCLMGQIRSNYHDIMNKIRGVVKTKKGQRKFWDLYQRLQYIRFDLENVVIDNSEIASKALAFDLYDRAYKKKSNEKDFRLREASQ